MSAGGARSTGERRCAQGSRGQKSHPEGGDGPAGGGQVVLVPGEWNLKRHLILGGCVCGLYQAHRETGAHGVTLLTL